MAFAEMVFAKRLDINRFPLGELITLPYTDAPTPAHFCGEVGETRAAGLGVRPGPVCWCCGKPGHSQNHCHVMELGALVWIPDTPQAAPDQARMYRIPVSVQGVHTMHWWIRAVTRPQPTNAWFKVRYWGRHVW